MSCRKKETDDSEIDYRRIVKFVYILILSVSLPLIVMTALINPANILLPANIMFSVTYIAAFTFFAFFRKIPMKVYSGPKKLDSKDS